MSEGFVFGQTGRLQLSKKLDPAWQASVMGLYKELRDILAKEYSYDLLFFYGTLLGAVREGTVIGHDVDFDAAYISAHTDPRAAALELKHMGLLLIDRGYQVKCAHTALHVYARDGSGLKVDIFHTYFDANDVLCLPFGSAGSVDIMRSEWKGTTEIDFCGSRGLVPAEPERFAEMLYGSGWRSPQPGFDWERDRTKRDWPGVLTVADKEEVYWANFYAHTEFDNGSTFFEKVKARPELPGTSSTSAAVDGRDSSRSVGRPDGARSGPVDGRRGARASQSV